MPRGSQQGEPGEFQQDGSYDIGIFFHHDSASIFAGLAPIAIAVSLGFLAFSFPLGALSLEIGGRLGCVTVIVDSVIGLQSVATLLSRHQAQSTGIGTAFFVGAIATTAAVLLLPSGSFPQKY